MERKTDFEFSVSQLEHGIAIIGIACRFPGANDYNQFWQNLEQGVNSITEIPQQRWEVEKYYSPNPEVPQTTISKWGGLMQSVDEFDAQFFGISPREAQRMDPQQRIMLELSWSCLEDAGYSPLELSGSQVGVFIGACNYDYDQLQHQIENKIEGHTATGTYTCIIPNRISYFFNFHGPSVPVDTACSSSLVALHQAVNAIQGEECGMALVGGVSVLCTPTSYISFSQLGMLSPKGQCKTFDSEADGYVRGEGAGIILLKPLAQAIEDKNYIYGVIKGGAVNHGGKARTLTSPNVYAQAQVVSATYKKANIAPNTVSYIETHGTGTPLGDPIEINGLKRSFRQLHQQYELPLSGKPYCGLGAVKTNIGHLEAASGIAGVIKVVLAMKHRKLPKMVNFKQLNPRFKLEGSPFYIIRETQDWQQLKTESGAAIPRRAGVSAFGFGGVNAHVVLEEAPVQVKSQSSHDRPIQIFTLSAKTEPALRDLVSSYHTHLETNPELELADICHTTNNGRAHFSHRLAAIATSPQQLTQKLRQYQAGEEESGVFLGQLSHSSSSAKVAFLFTGQGSQYVNMGRQLYQTQSTFLQALDRCDQILRPYLEHSLLEVLYPQNTQNSNSSLLNQTAYTQPALFAIEYALFKLWESWEIKPNVVMGHSVGEYVAATVAGVFSLEDGLKLIAARGRLMQGLPAGGEMVSVMASESKVLETLKAMSLEDKVDIAAINGPQSIVISGESEAVRAIATNLESTEIKTKQLQVSHAFHSHLMEPMLAEFESVAEEINYHEPKIPLISNVTGKLVGEEITSAKYWVNHVRQPVRFADSMTTLHQEGYELYLEIGPKPILLGMGRQCLPEGVGVWLPSLRPGVEAWQQMLSSLGQLYVRGAKIDWRGFDKDYTCQKVVLPTYPFQRERYWLEAEENGHPQQSSRTSEQSNTAIVNLLSQGETGILTQQLEKSANFSPEQLKFLPEILEVLAHQHQQQLATAQIKDWFYQLQWQPLPQTQAQTSLKPSHWLIFADNTGLAEKLAQALQEQGHECSLVYRGDNYQERSAGTYQINPSASEEFEQLHKAIEEDSQLPLSTVIHLWSLDAPTTEDLTLDSLEETQEWGCGSILYLLQTLLKTTNLPQLWLVTRGTRAVLSYSEELTVAASSLWGFGRVVSLENPQLWGGLVDLDPQTPENEVEALLKLLVTQPEEDHLALRGEQTYVARLVLVRQSPQASVEPLSLASDATYMITGGMGALGLHTAQWLVEKGARNLVLTGRSEPSETAQESIDELEQAGAQVKVLLGDIAVEQDVAKIIEQIQTSLPTLKGIIHAAGVLDDATLEQMSWSHFTKVMASKVKGTWNLHQLTQDIPLDFFVCFSSMAALIGLSGQGNYAAANAFMDALVRYRRSVGLSGLSINWGAWKSGGMATRLAVEHQNRMHTSGISNITPKQGMYALEQLLSNQAQTGQVGFVSVDWSLLAKRWSNFNKSSLIRELLPPEILQQQEALKQKQNRDILAELEKALPGESQEILTEYIRDQVARVLGLSLSQLPEVNLGLMEMGMDSLTSVELKNRLQAQLGITLPATVAIEYPTIAKLSQYILEEAMAGRSLENSERNISESQDILAEESKTQENANSEKMEIARNEPIAIIGIGCRFPGNVNTPESFWQLLANGEDTVKEIPPERWDIDSHYHPDPETPGKMYIRHASLVEDVDQFDTEFFGISPREANSLDPQQRFLLEVTWEALERAGINPQQLENTQTGVFLGMGQNDYANLSLYHLENISHYDGTGNPFCFAPGRLSYFLGLQGPSLVIDTACSSSLVAIHQACQSLRQHESNLAVAGGVQLILSPQITTALSKLKALSPDGKCKTFDAAADGYGRGEGCGMMVLKRLSDAVKDGAPIWAVIRGSAVNHDGPSSGLTVPNKLAQEKLIQQALKVAKVKPSQVGYIEAHGTGTSLGDPMEVRALATVFEEGHNQEKSLKIGSVKTNIGHLEAAAGIAGLIKVVLQLQHQKIAPHLNFVNPNPYIDWENLPLEVPTQLTPWPSSGGKRVGGVSSFGISGTNAHVVLEEAPREGNRQQATGKSEDDLERSVNLLTLSAKTEIALAELVSSYLHYLENHPELKLEDVCHTANTGRAHFKHRLAVIASESKELAEKLLSVKTGEEVVGLFSGQTRQNPPKIAFLFTGQGSQYVNMGRQLYETQPTFRQALEQCDRILQPYLEHSLLEALYPEGAEPSRSSLLNQTAYTQPAVFAIEYALFKLWESWGIKPNAVMGHSVGEYVAATVAGVFSLEDALKLIATRGKLMQKLPPGGKMVSLMASEPKVREQIAPYAEKVDIAAINGPESVVISGEAEAIAAIVTAVELDGVKTKQLQVSHAFHSPLMEPILAEFEAIAKQIIYHQPKIPLISNVTGTKADNSIATANYWVNHIRQPVKFVASMETLHQQGSEVFLEIGSKPILLGMGRQCLPEDIGAWLPSLRSGVDEWQQMLSSLGQLYVQGASVDWSGFDQDYSYQKVLLPTYPFQRQRYWVETVKGGNSQATFATKLHPLINQKFQSPLAKEIFFESHFSTKNLPFLADHRIYEQVVVPGASHISLLLGAASLTLPTTECQLENILFPQALAIPDQGTKTVQVALTPQENSYGFQVISCEDYSDLPTNELSNNGNQGSSCSIHATGKLATTKTDRSQLPLEEIQARCHHPIDHTEVYQHLWERQIQLGESFRWIDRIWLGEGEVLCQMKVPKTILDATQYQLHPALIDSCFQSIIALDLSQFEGNKETFVPFSVEKFIFYNRPQSGLLWCYTRVSKDTQSEDQLKADIELFDQDGQLVAQITGFECRKANPETLLMTLGSDLSHWFYQINWQAQPLPSIAQSNQNETGNWLVFAMTNEWVELMGQQLSQKGYSCIWVSPGSKYQKLGDRHYQINPTIAEQFQQLLQDNADIKGIVHLWGVNETETREPVGIQELQTAQELGCATALHLVRAITQAGLTHLVPMWFVTQGTQSVFDETEVVQPQQGSVWGLGRAIRLEQPELGCFRVDLDPNSPIVEAIPNLVDELLSNNGEDQIAIRQGVRYVARLGRQPKQKVTSPQLSIRSEACYLITGGLGALGLQVAQWLVSQGAKHLILIGRSAPNEIARETIDKLEAAGSQVSVLSGDISEQQDAVRIINQIQDSLPPLKGIIHAAGLLEDGLVQNLSWQQFTKVMAPKVAGTWYLHQLTKDFPLDFFVCFSSMASMLGSPGQGNYAAANAFMDAIAYYRRGMGLPGLSINWGPWASAGMAARLGDEHSSRWQNLGVQPIGDREGIQALAEILKLGVAQVGVMPINWSQWFQVQTGITVPMLGDLVQKQLKPSQDGWLIQQLEAVSSEQRRQLLVRELQKLVAQVLGIADPERIDSQAGLFDLGIDSLMLAELRNRLQSSLGCSLSVTALFNYPNIDDLVDYLAQEVLETISFEELEEASTVELNPTEDLDELSADELAALLADELYDGAE